MAKQKNLTVISSATLVEIVKGVPVEREPGTPVSLPETEARSLVSRGLAKFAAAAAPLPSPQPAGDGEDGDGDGEDPPPGSTA